MEEVDSLEIDLPSLRDMVGYGAQGGGGVRGGGSVRPEIVGNPWYSAHRIDTPQ